MRGCCRVPSLTGRRRLLSHDADADAAADRYGPGYVTVTMTPLPSSVGVMLWRYTLQNSGYMLTEKISGLTQGVNISRNISVISPGNLVDFEFLPLLNDGANIQQNDQLCPWEYISNTGANCVDMNQYSDLRIIFEDFLITSDVQKLMPRSPPPMGQPPSPPPLPPPPQAPPLRVTPD
jgi:hypothetical protein